MNMNQESLHLNIESPAESRIKFPLESMPFAQMMEAVMADGGTGRLLR